MADDAGESDRSASILFVFPLHTRLSIHPPASAFDIETVVKLFLDWEHNKHANIMTFRDKAHRSVMTGTMVRRACELLCVFVVALLAFFFCGCRRRC